MSSIGFASNAELTPIRLPLHPEWRAIVASPRDLTQTASKAKK
jgi:hypothetical protein